MTDETHFDQAWAEWWHNLTVELSASAAAVSPRVRQALKASGAFDPGDGLIRRDWALGLMTRAGDQVRALTVRGVSDGEVRALVALIQRHPTPAAGG